MPGGLWADLRDVFTEDAEYIEVLADDNAKQNLFIEGRKPKDFRRAFADKIRNRAAADRSYAHWVKGATAFIEDALNGEVPRWQLQETLKTGKLPYWHAKHALSTSDFSDLFDDALDRMMVMGYERWEKVWDRFLKKTVVKDFRPITRFNMYGGQDGLPVVGELADYPATTRLLRSYSYSVTKYGKRYPVSWELLVNDDMDAFKSLPFVLGEDAAMAESEFATSLYAANATLFSVGNGNKGTGALSTANLKIAWNSFTTLRDDDGNPIMNRPKYLVVPPQLELTAREIVYPELQAPGQATANAVPRLGLEVIVDPFLPLVDLVQGTTGWYLFTEPTDRRFAAEVALLRGHEQPQMFEKISDARPISGGALIPEASFANDQVEWKVRHVFGGSIANAIGFYRYAYFSTGAA